MLLCQLSLFQMANNLDILSNFRYFWQNICSLLNECSFQFFVKVASWSLIVQMRREPPHKMFLQGTNELSFAFMHNFLFLWKLLNLYPNHLQTYAQTITLEHAINQLQPKRKTIVVYFNEKALVQWDQMCRNWTFLAIFEGLPILYLQKFQLTLTKVLCHWINFHFAVNVKY